MCEFCCNEATTEAIEVVTPLGIELVQLCESCKATPPIDQSIGV